MSTHGQTKVQDCVIGAPVARATNGFDLPSSGGGAEGGGKEEAPLEQHSSAPRARVRCCSIVCLHRKWFMFHLFDAPTRAEVGRSRPDDLLSKCLQSATPRARRCSPHMAADRSGGAL